MRRIPLVVLLVVVFCWAPAAFADTIWYEIGDAGNYPGGAQWVLGSGPLTQIRGQLNDNTNTPLVDVYAIYINDPVNFSASTSSSFGLDPELFLFAMNSTGLEGSDNISSNNKEAYLPGAPSGSNAQPGIYYLWISDSGRDPGDSSGNPIFQYSSIGANGEYIHPDGVLYRLSGVGPVVGPIGTALTTLGSDYTINLTGTSFIPEPTSLFLLGTGLGVIGLAAWRRKK